MLLDYFKCAEDFGPPIVARDLSTEAGFFQFGRDITCYGQCAGGSPSKQLLGQPIEKSHLARFKDRVAELPFDLSQIVNNLRYERYAPHSGIATNGITGSAVARRLYYFLRPLLSVPLRKHLQRARLRGWEQIKFPQWPVDFTVDVLMERALTLAVRSSGAASVPFIWFWPDGAPSCAVMTHDVESAAGRDFCHELMNLDDQFSIKSSFQIVPEVRYDTGNGFLDRMRSRGFEVNVHDLNHDGFLFRDREEFTKRAKRINQCIKEFKAEGFRSGAMYRNQDWYEEFEFSYDMSVPNVAHLEPQRGGCCTVMPYFIGKILELPLTTIQDYSLFHMLGDYSTNRWQQQIELIMQRNGLVSFITHPDYLMEVRARNVYLELLAHLAHLRKQKKLWITLPREVNRWWRNRRQMRLVRDGERWKVEGKDSNRARVAYATVKDDRIAYQFDSTAEDAVPAAFHKR